jgi:hypothetical protein
MTDRDSLESSKTYITYLLKYFQIIVKSANKMKVFLTDVKDGAR